MKLSKTQVKVIIITFVLALFLSGYGYVFITIKNKNNHISVLQNQIDIEAKKDSRLHSIKSLLADLDKEIEQIDTYFVVDNEVVDFLEDIENLGLIAGVSISVNSVSVDEEITKELPFDLLKVKFVSRGKWSSIIHLVSLLETFSLGIIINEVRLEKLTDSESWQGNISFSVLKLK